MATKRNEEPMLSARKVAKMYRTTHKTVVTAWRRGDLKGEMRNDAIGRSYMQITKSDAAKWGGPRPTGRPKSEAKKNK